MSDERKDDGSSGRPAVRAGADDADLEIPKHTVLEMLPRRSLMKAFLLLAILAIVIALQRSSKPMLRAFTDALYPPPAGTAPTPPVRMAPPAPPPASAGNPR